MCIKTEQNTTSRNQTEHYPIANQQCLVCGEKSQGLCHQPVHGDGTKGVGCHQREQTPVQKYFHGSEE